MQHYFAHIAVIGGGASGLAAAIEAKRQGGSDCRVAIIEKNARLGKKLLATGNGRCNLGNIEEKQRKHYSGSCTELAEDIFSRYDGSEAFFKSLGVICRSDSGRLYPYSNHAASVLDALRFQVQELGINIFTETDVTGIQASADNRWLIKTSGREVLAEKIIVACGGKAAPAMGTTGDFYKTIQSLDHSITNVTPALCPIYTEPALLHGLKGIRTLAKASLYDNKGKLVVSDSGEVQLTEKALSGICIFNLAAYAVQQNMYISLDLLPDITDYQVQELLWEIYAMRSQWKTEDMLSGIFQKKMCAALFRASGIKAHMDAPVYTLTPTDIERLSSVIKAWRFPVTGLGDWSTAQVTAGGVPASEIGHDLQSKLHSGIYFSGEILDIAGECGGYNLAWAWCSGIHAARMAVSSLKGCESCD